MFKLASPPLLLLVLIIMIIIILTTPKFSCSEPSFRYWTVDHIELEDVDVWVEQKPDIGMNAEVFRKNMNSAKRYSTPRPETLNPEILNPKP